MEADNNLNEKGRNFRKPGEGIGVMIKADAVRDIHLLCPRYTSLFRT